METYKAVMATIHKLEKKAERLRRIEIKGVIERIRDAMVHYGLTAEDLGLSGQSAATRSPVAASVKTAAKAQAKKPANPGAPKYRDPASGKTWTGRGKPPNWIVGATNREDLLIAANTPAPVAAAAERRAEKTKAVKRLLASSARGKSAAV